MTLASSASSASDADDFQSLPDLVELIQAAGEMRAELTSYPVRYTGYEREYLGWGVFALIRR